MKKRFTTFLVWFGFVFVFFLFYNLLKDQRTPRHEPFSHFLSQLKTDELKQIWVNGTNIEVEPTISGASRYTTHGNIDDKLLDTLDENGVIVHWEPRKKPSSMLETIITSLLPIIVLIAVWIFL